MIVSLLLLVSSVFVVHNHTVHVAVVVEFVVVVADFIGTLLL